jgi:hypothetical protein
LFSVPPSLLIATALFSKLRANPLPSAVAPHCALSFSFFERMQQVDGFDFSCRRSLQSFSRPECQEHQPQTPGRSAAMLGQPVWQRVAKAPPTHLCPLCILLAPARMSGCRCFEKRVQRAAVTLAADDWGACAVRA